MFLKGLKLNFKSFGNHEVIDIFIFGNRSAILFSNNTVLFFGGNNQLPELVGFEKNRKILTVGLGQDWELLSLNDFACENNRLKD